MRHPLTASASPSALGRVVDRFLAADGLVETPDLRRRLRTTLGFSLIAIGTAVGFSGMYAFWLDSTVGAVTLLASSAVAAVVAH